ncbi:anti-sigma factor family protein [Streptomyces sp. NPDC088725]|uniref:anti-sigma factor family protein n=1 Tax=Streptomyces sp. NPDC088725 TaxID=3365873 RepID=UPI0038071257
MTSAADTAQHPDVSEIADLTEGLLSPSRAIGIRRHLEGCSLCADVHDSLEEIKGLLGELPAPVPMPADVAERIDAALAAEALQGVISADAVDVSRETSATSETSTGPATGASAEPTPTEPARIDRPAGRPRAATGPGRDRTVRRRNRRAVVLGTVFGAAAIGVSILLLHSMGQTSSDSAASAAAGARTPSGRDGGQEFAGDRLQASVDALLASGPAAMTPEPPKPGGSATADRSRPNTLLQPVPAVPGCIQQGTGRTEAALAVERGTFQGSGAYLVVFPDPADSTQVQAYVIDATCVDTASATKGKVLLTHSYPRR